MRVACLQPRCRTLLDRGSDRPEIAAERDRSADLVAVLGESASLGYESADVSSSQARPHNRKPSEDFIEFGRHNRSGSTTRWAFDPNRSDDGGDMVFTAPASTAVASANEGDEHSDASMAILASPGTVIKTGAHDGGSGFSSFLYGGDAPAARRGIGANGGVDADTDCADTVVVSRGPSFGEADFGDAAFSTSPSRSCERRRTRRKGSADVGTPSRLHLMTRLVHPQRRQRPRWLSRAPDAAGGMKLFNNDAFDGVLGDAEPKPDNTAPAAVTTAAVGSSTMPPLMTTPSVPRRLAATTAVPLRVLHWILRACRRQPTHPLMESMMSINWDLELARRASAPPPPPPPPLTPRHRRSTWLSSCQSPR